MDWRALRNLTTIYAAFYITRHTHSPSPSHATVASDTHSHDRIQPLTSLITDFNNVSGATIYSRVIYKKTEPAPLHSLLLQALVFAASWTVDIYMKQE